MSLFCHRILDGQAPQVHTLFMPATNKPTAAQISAYRTLMSARVVTQSDLNREKTRTAALKTSLAKRGLSMADLAGVDL